MPARFYEVDVRSKLKNKRALSAFLDTLVLKHRKEADSVKLTYIFCDDHYLLQLNKQFLDHDTYTDIVTFDLSEDAQEVVSEIYISTDRIGENAEKFDTTYDEELHRVIIHGALHLCGFKDKSAADKEQMRNMEDKSIRSYFKQLDK